MVAKSNPVMTIVCPMCKGSGYYEYPAPAGDASSIVDTCGKCGGSKSVVQYINPVTNDISYTRIPI